MSVVAVEQLFKDRGATFNWDALQEFQETYMVRCDDATDGPYIAVLEGQKFVQTPPLRLPFLGETHPRSNFAVCIHLDPQPYTGSDPFNFRVTARYETFKGDEQQITLESPDPLAQKPEFLWDFSTEQVPLDKEPGDTGKLTLNAAGQKFDPPPLKDAGPVTLWFQRNEAKDRTPDAVAFRHTVNKKPWTVVGFGVGPGVAKVVKITSKFTLGRAGPAGIHLRYFVVTYEFAFREEGWDAELLNQGTEELGVFLDNGRKTMGLINILDKEGEQIRAPQPLTAEGQAIPRDEYGKFIEEPNFMTFKRYPRKNFKKLLNYQTIP